MAQQYQLLKLHIICKKTASALLEELTSIQPISASLIQSRDNQMWFFGRRKSSGISNFSTAEEVTHEIDGSSLTAIVTGASSGLGAETTRVLALRGVHVFMAVRNMAAGRDIRAKILDENPSAKVDIMELDLSSMASIRKFASDYKSLNYPLNLLINNAGVFACPFTLSQDNIELQFATNHLAAESGKEGRILIVSSQAHRLATCGGIRFDSLGTSSGYSSFFAYCQSKLANILHANELARLLKDDRVKLTANSIHPGVIYTNIHRYNSFFNGVFYMLNKIFLRDVPHGAATICYVALHPEVEGTSGGYFSDCKLAKPSKQAQDITLAWKLWDFSMDLIK
ncbi:short-chain dehydrogenase TIC 32, chloroplastic isoform X2 [Beta vulgaris subsp. vulgaris]|uniref:short-chain dehydrogenase TIC 32, chloroplastic isoform X2 n=1 Tax=Beta vulgaris subsp. vulgaris TaxID=3555 RepID=UPI0020376828|nr:short-chain dehydrogenase TIC 32, chloroplastic isoform X2 [Beta vulgaris subsp. vulgaris]